MRAGRCVSQPRSRVIDFGTLWDGLIAINEDDLAFIKAQIEKERQQMSDNSGNAPSAVQERTIGSDLDRLNDVSLGIEERLSQIMNHLNLKRDQGDEKAGSIAAVTRIDERFNQADMISRRLIDTQRDLDFLLSELNRL